MMKRTLSPISSQFRFSQEDLGRFFKRYPLFRHIFFITAFVLFMAVDARIMAVDARITEPNPTPFWDSLLESLLVYALCTVHNTVLFERFLLRKRFLQYGILLLCLIISATLLFLRLPIYRMAIEQQKIHLPWWQEFYNIAIWTTAIYLIAGFGIYLVYRYAFKIQQERLQYDLLLREKELDALKAQINPHFLFNSLNALYATVLETPETATEHILQLAHLMRYQLESGKKELVNLGDEITFLQDFIALEQHRIGNRCTISVEFAVPMEHRRSIRIPPLVLLPLIENAIKYGAASSVYIPDNEAFVSIVLQQTPTHLFLETHNSVAEKGLFGNAEKTPTPSTKIGLENLRKRLQYLYNTQATLETVPNPTHFFARLVIPLK